MIASIILAAIITAGSTFAWLTSTDSVTNRLTAKADYGVSITETFTPPGNWTPDVAVDKDVGSVNTGNMSAFVKLTLSNKLTVTAETNGDTYIAATTNTGAIIYKSSDTADTKTDVTSTFIGDTTAKLETDEVKAIKAGGALVYTTSSNTADTGVVVDVNSTGGVGTNFTPSGTGLYIFRRSVDGTTSSPTYTYSGFYFVDDSTNDTAGVGTYYKLATKSTTKGSGDNTTPEATTELPDNSVTVVSNKVTGCKFTFRTETTATDVEPTLSYDATNLKITATYDVNKDTSGTTNTSDDIIIYINLAANANNNWTYGGTNSSASTGANTEAYFYLNKVLEPGETSAMLVDSVTLDGNAKGKYTSLTYDLNVDLSSVQVVYNDGSSEEKGGINATKSAEAAVDQLIPLNTDKKNNTESKGLDTVAVDTTNTPATVTWSKKS